MHTKNHNKISEYEKFIKRIQNRLLDPIIKNPENNDVNLDIFRFFTPLNLPLISSTFQINSTYFCKQFFILHTCPLYVLQQGSQTQKLTGGGQWATSVGYTYWE